MYAVSLHGRGFPHLQTCTLANRGSSEIPKKEISLVGQNGEEGTCIKRILANRSRPRSLAERLLLEGRINRWMDRPRVK